MNKFKLLSNSVDQHAGRKVDGSHEQKQQRRDQVQLLNILDKCTQILRDDRIWIRNRIKENDQDIIAIFRKSRRNPNNNRISEAQLHQLQVNLRKHVNRIKERHKQEQLIRFKENMCATNCTCQKGRGTHSTHKTHFAQQRRYEDSRESYPFQQSQESYKPVDQQTFNSLFKNKKKLLDTLKMHQPIEQQSEKDTEKMSSYRSRSEEPQNRMHYEEKHYRATNGYKQSSKKLRSSRKDLESSNEKQEWTEEKQDWMQSQSSHKDKFTPSKQEDVRNNWSMYNVVCHPPTDHSVHFDQSKNITYEYNQQEQHESYAQVKSDKKSESKEPTNSAPSTNNLLVAFQPSAQKESESKITQVKHTYENYSYNFTHTASFNQTKYSFPDYKPFDFSSGLNINSTTVTGIGSTSITNTANQYSISSNISSATKESAFPKPIPPIQQSFTKVETNFPKVTADNDNLFTSPELLMECRKILQKSGEKKSSAIFDNYTMPLTSFTSSLPLSANSSTSALPAYNFSTMEPSIPYSGSTDIHPINPQPYTFTSTYLNNNFGLKNMYKGTQSIVQPNDISQPKADSPFKFPNVVGQAKPLKLESVVTKDCFSEVKEILPKSKMPDIKPLESLNEGQFNLDDVSPEEAFDLIFLADTRQRNSVNMVDSHMDSTQFKKIAQTIFKDVGKLDKVFEFCDKQSKNIISALDFGRVIQKVLHKNRQQPSQIKQIFSLIDIKQKGYFTLEDYQRFLEQVLESEQDNYEEVARMAYRLFEMADCNNNKQVEYWGLYLTKQTDDFQQFSEYLEQFEFQVEI